MPKDPGHRIRCPPAEVFGIRHRQFSEFGWTPVRLLRQALSAFRIGGLRLPDTGDHKARPDQLLRQRRLPDGQPCRFYEQVAEQRVERVERPVGFAVFYLKVLTRSR